MHNFFIGLALFRNKAFKVLHSYKEKHIENKLALKSILKTKYCLRNKNLIIPCNTIVMIPFLFFMWLWVSKDSLKATRVSDFCWHCIFAKRWAKKNIKWKLSVFSMSQALARFSQSSTCAIHQNKKHLKNNKDSIKEFNVEIIVAVSGEKKTRKMAMLSKNITKKIKCIVSTVFSSSHLDFST